MPLALVAKDLISDAPRGLQCHRPVRLRRGPASLDSLSVTPCPLLDPPVRQSSRAPLSTRTSVLCIDWTTAPSTAVLCRCLALSMPTALSPEAREQILTQLEPGGSGANTAAVRDAVQNGARLDALDGWGRTALHHAAIHAEKGAPAVQELLLLGADPDAQDDAGNSALMSAAAIGR
jgi:hypothetical protein